MGAQGSTMAARHNGSSRTGIKSLLPACRPRLPSITRADFSGQMSSFMSLDQVNAYPQALQVRLQITAIAHMPNASLTAHEREKRQREQWLDRWPWLTTG
jgi:hypothetical protein